MQKFEPKVEAGERGRVFITIPFDPSEEWGAKSRHYVKGTINGVPFEGSLGAKKGVFIMPLNKEIQSKTGATPGEKIKVVMEPGVAGLSDLPQDLLEALAPESRARAFFDGLSAFYRNQYVGWIESAKKDETRKQRIEQTVALLKAQKKQR